MPARKKPNRIESDNSDNGENINITDSSDSSDPAQAPTIPQAPPVPVAGLLAPLLPSSPTSRTNRAHDIDYFLQEVQRPKGSILSARLVGEFFVHFWVVIALLILRCDSAIKRLKTQTWTFLHSSSLQTLAIPLYESILWSITEMNT